MSREGTKQIYGILKSQSAVYNLSKNRISIGRSKSSVIIINHPSVSKDHAIIEFDSDLVPSIKDLNSSNGTYVNGQKLQTFPQNLKTNDKISFGKDPTEYIFESFNQENEKTVVYPQIVHDGKISLVNENAYQSPKINHFKNKNAFYMNNNYNNEFMMKQQQNLPPQNMFINPINNENAKYNEQPQFFNADTENNENILDTNNVNTNNEVTFKKQSEDFTKKINQLTQEKEEMNKKITELENTVTSKTNEVKKVSDLFDQLTEEYSKLNSKHNALMIYASDLQKKVDILEIDLQDAKANEQNKDFVKILSEKDSLITILQNEIQYYKDQLKNKSQFNISNYPQQSGYSSMNNNNNIQENSILVKKIDELTENYIKENKKLKEKIEKIKKKYKNPPITQQNNNPNAFAEFESQLNLQISNFNQIIADYNNRLSEAVSRIPIMFEGDKKEEAAKYLVEQVNQFMSENQKLLSDNARLNLQINQLQNEINNTKANQYLQVTNRNENIETKSKESEEEDNEEISNLKKKVDELESVISKLQNNNNTNYNDYYSTSSNRFGISNNTNTNDKEMKECLINAINELREKEKTIDELKTKLKDTISKTPMNFDERQIVSSVSQTLREKDNLIQSLQNQLTSSKINTQSPLVN